MTAISKTKTAQNLARAWFIETSNIRRCEIFAKQAKKEGFEQISAIFLEVAEQKRSHTKTILRFLEDCDVELALKFTSHPWATTLECLKNALQTEQEESDDIFEEFERTAWEEGYKQIATKFKLFRRIKSYYHQRYSKLVANIEEGKVFKRNQKVKWICRKCGLIYESEHALKNCPGCEHPQAYFEILAENY
ncbi:MAG: ferritin family protein [Lentimicrobium sp.]|jgi:rubrerythrin|nr:ferritin family protein [Lentimicrobium sp.]